MLILVFFYFALLTDHCKAVGCYHCTGRKGDASNTLEKCDKSPSGDEDSHNDPTIPCLGDTCMKVTVKENGEKTSVVRSCFDLEKCIQLNSDCATFTHEEFMATINKCESPHIASKTNKLGVSALGKVFTTAGSSSRQGNPGSTYEVCACSGDRCLPPENENTGEKTGPHKTQCYKCTTSSEAYKDCSAYNGRPTSVDLENFPIEETCQYESSVCGRIDKLLPKEEDEEPETLCTRRGCLHKGIFWQKELWMKTGCRYLKEDVIPKHLQDCKDGQMNGLENGEMGSGSEMPTSNLSSPRYGDDDDDDAKKPVYRVCICSSGDLCNKTSSLKTMTKTAFWVVVGLMTSYAINTTI